MDSPAPFFRSQQGLLGSNSCSMVQGKVDLRAIFSMESAESLSSPPLPLYNHHSDLKLRSISIPDRGLMAKMFLGARREEVVEPDLIRSVLTELLLTFLFVFVGVGTTLTAEKLAGGQQDTVAGLLAAALAQAMLVAVMTAVGLDVCAGQMNPAVTIGFATGRYVSIVRCVLYVIVQLLGSSVACLLLKYITGGMDLPVNALAAGMNPGQGVIMEAVFTFSMVFSVYALIMAPKKGVVSSSAPLLIGLVVGGNSLAGGAFSGASMNPARSFGPALASWNWTNHWVYWLGPISGSGLAGFAYHQLYIATSHAALLEDTDEEAF